MENEAKIKSWNKFAHKVYLEKIALKKFDAEKKRKMFALKSFSEIN